jgi:geranylgeranyl diphosphate synthase type II
MNENGGSSFDRMLEDDRRSINDRLAAVLPAEDEPPRSLHEAMRYATLGGGKRLRGILCIAGHRLFGNRRPAAALDAACAIECLHAYSLIHDDLPDIDDDDMRRGRPSCHRQFGNAVAILAGDALQALAFDILSRCEGSQGSVLETIRILSRTAGSLSLVGGQVADIEGEGKEATAEAVMFIHTRKTAALISASLSIGAVLAGASKRDRVTVDRIGRTAGLAFQIIDDILDVTGVEKNVGKGLRKDAKRRKITYPAHVGLERSRSEARRMIAEARDAIRGLGDAGYIQHIFSLIVQRVS